MADTERTRPLARFDWLLGESRSRPRPEALDLAIDAWERGQAALTSGDLAAARHWAERAARLGPEDTQVQFLLGIVLLRQQDRAAFQNFQRLIVASDTIPAYRGLVAAAALIGDRASCIQAVGTLLARFAPPTDAEFPGLAMRAAAAAGVAGWCGADAAGRVTVSAQGEVRVALDDRVVAPRRRPDGRWRLPASWTEASVLTVTADGRHLLGSPIDLGRRRLVEGFVEADGGGLRGWAWHPADPEAAVRLTLGSATGRQPAIPVETAEPAHFPNMDGLMAPKAFHVPVERLQDRPGLLHLRDGEGRDLTGSPLVPGLWTGSADRRSMPDGSTPGRTEKRATVSARPSRRRADLGRYTRAPAHHCAPPRPPGPGGRHPCLPRHRDDFAVPRPSSGHGAGPHPGDRGR